MRHFSGDMDGIRLLMADELLLIAGGDGEDGDSVPEEEITEVIIKGQRKPSTYSGGGVFTWPSGVQSYLPDCHKTNEVQGIPQVDNAPYVLPEDVTPEYIQSAILYLMSIENYAMKMAAFYDMYENKNHQFYIDFKDWGSTKGPDGTYWGGMVTYHSDVTGQDVTSKVFEPFGNYLYGFIGRAGGLTAFDLQYVAGLVQSNNTFWERITGQDSAEDKPHVLAGIAAAETWLVDGIPPRMQLIMGSCS